MKIKGRLKSDTRYRMCDNVMHLGKGMHVAHRGMVVEVDIKYAHLLDIEPVNPDDFKTFEEVKPEPIPEPFVIADKQVTETHTKKARKKRR